MLVKLPEAITIGALHRQFTLAQGEIIEPDTLVDSFTSDSQQVQPGTLFIACRGAGIDGHNFLDAAYKSGASAVVVANAALLEGRPGFEVSNARILISRLSSFAFKHPSESLKVIGITGTNGKTTTNWMLYHALNRLGEKCIRIGTLGYEISGGNSSKDTLTTPSPEDMHKLLALALEAGCSHAVIEISSHALHQHRVDDVSFDSAVFTNITHDHLDYHRTFDEYLRAKKRLFEIMKGSKKDSRIFCANLSTKEGAEIASIYANSFEHNRSFGFNDDSPVQIKEIVTGRTSSQITFLINKKELKISSCFLGKHNAENLAVVAGLLDGMSYAHDAIANVLSALPPVPGRLEAFEQNGVAVFVDYAHSPDALERVIGCLAEIPHKRLILVFGCGGNRDWRKRALMGNIAARNADYVFVTNDNPRHEDPEVIIKDILESELALESSFQVIPDRSQAIKAALSLANEGDIVLIAGKGHEDYQIVGDKKHYFSDQNEIRDFFGTRTR